MKNIVTMTNEKVQKVTTACKLLLLKPVVTIRKLAEIIGLIVSSFPGAEFAQLHYRDLEGLKSDALRAKFGNFDAQILLNEASKNELKWWIDHIWKQNCHIVHPSPEKLF